MNYSQYADKILEISKEAAAIIMRYYDGKVHVEIKDDKSPVTAADIAANQYIVTKLKELAPEIAIVSEENPEQENIAAAESELFWLVDPLDGTKSFIKRTGEFTVNIALIKNGRPVSGVVYVPAQNVGYYTGSDNKAYKISAEGIKSQISTRVIPGDGAIVVASLSHRTPETDQYINSLPKVKSIVAASSSIKFCLVAEGAADTYPRFGRTMEWDTAAGHAVLLAAGGRVDNIDGSELLYGKKGLDNPYFVAQGRS